MALRVAQSDGVLEAKARLPDQWQVDTLKVGKTNILASEALHVFDAVDYDRTAEDVT